MDRLPAPDGAVSAPNPWCSIASMSAGDMRGEAPVVTTVNGFFGELVEDWRGARSINCLYIILLCGVFLVA